MKKKKKAVRKNYFYVLISESNHVKIGSTLEKAVQRMRGAGIPDHNVAQYKCSVNDSPQGYVRKFIDGNEFDFKAKHREHFDSEVMYFLKHVYKKICKCD